MSPLPDYAELHCLSQFSFQRGASSAAELFERARALGYRALAITDECSLAGIVRAWQASRSSGVPLIVGSEFQLADGPRLVLLVEQRQGYQRLCALITLARRRMPKGQYRLLREDLEGDNSGLLALWLPDLRTAEPELHTQARGLHGVFPQRLWLAVELHRGPDDAQRLSTLRTLAQTLQLPMVATGDVHMHIRNRRALQDVLTAVRHQGSLADAGLQLFANGERHLRRRELLATLYPAQLLLQSVQIAQRIDFDLKRDLHYTYPHELVPAGHSPTSWLRVLTEQGARWRWPQGPGAQVNALLEKELGIIAELGYESYFLTVHDVVRYAREQGILCQGRGSAANSAVCFALGITELDPAQSRMLFERFISRERNEPPDIDVDFEHERREEVLQYVFRRYGRDRAALTAVATTYGGRGALREVARALGLAQEAITRLSQCVGHWSDSLPSAQRLREAGFDPDSPLLGRILTLAGELLGAPHYLSQHPGGFVISEHPLSTLVPVENAAMEGRTVIQWDKDDLDAMGLLKVDVLALGMLSALRKTFALLALHRDRRLSIATLPQDDPATYRMICQADTIGVFQIESRAQMAMLPRLQPRCFYDLVIEVAIVRPGPIQGDMVHPYLRRRRGEEPVDYPSAALEEVFRRTLGVPLFQEQVMELAIVAAGYSPGEADQLRRSMAAWKRHGGLEPHRERISRGMLERGYSAEFAARIFEQIKGFGSYGFPESHAASFALLCYASAWLKCHEPAAFSCALLNSQPMGFYSVDQLLADARRHGIQIRPVDVRHSHWDCTLENTRMPAAQPALRLGLRLIRGLAVETAQIMMQAREQQAFADVADLCERARLDQRQRGLLADAGALKGLAGHRHRARWSIAGVEPERPLLSASTARPEAQVKLPLPSRSEDLLADYAMLGTTMGPHPLTLLRPRLRARRLLDSAALKTLPHGRLAAFAGLVSGRQRPQTASGVTFVTLEDEHGMVNVVVWRQLAERQRRVLVQSRLLLVRGTLESSDGVQHLIAGQLQDLSELLDGLDQRSRDFH